MDERHLENSPGTHVDDVVIRPMAKSDAHAIAHLWEKLVAYHHNLDADLPAASPNGGLRYAQRLVDRLNDTYARTYVAEADGEVIGFVLGIITDMTLEMFEPATGGFLADIYVDDAYRGYGVGHKLVDAIMDWFRSRGIEYFEWHVAAKNTDGQKFWQSIGGRQVMHRMRMKL